MLNSVIECKFLIPVRSDRDVGDGKLHSAEAWAWLTAELHKNFDAMRIAPGLYEGVYPDPDTQGPVWDYSRQYLVAIPEVEFDHLRKLLETACGVFLQKSIYLTIGCKVEFVTNPELDAF